jgi:hypothetical protein
MGRFDETDEGRPGGTCLQYRSGSVTGAVIHHDTLQLRVRMQDVLSDYRTDALLDIVPKIVACDDHGKLEHEWKLPLSGAPLLNAGFE